MAEQSLTLIKSLNLKDQLLGGVIKKIKDSEKALDAKAAADVISSIKSHFDDAVAPLVNISDTARTGDANEAYQKAAKALDEINTLLTDPKLDVAADGATVKLGDSVDLTIPDDDKADVKTGAEAVAKLAKDGAIEKAVRDAITEIDKLTAADPVPEKLDATAGGKVGAVKTALEDDANKDLSKNLNTGAQTVRVAFGPVNPRFNEDEKDLNHFMERMAALVFNGILEMDKPEEGEAPPNPLFAVKTKLREKVEKVDQVLYAQLDAILHDEKFRGLEANWRSLLDLLHDTDFSKDIMIDVLDVTKDELKEDFDSNRVDITNSAFFKKIYVAEYDQYGGRPFGSIVGMYEFDNNREDRNWLETMGKIAAAAHAPFVSSVGPTFFGANNIQELADIKDLPGHMSQPRYDNWNKFRDSEEAAYIGLALPQFLVRAPYDPETNPAGDLQYSESVEVNGAANNGDGGFLWGNAAMLFAKNMTRSFAESGWCQYLRGPKGGGLQQYLPRYSFDHNGHKEMKIPVEMVIPDYREYDYAKEGFMPLIYRKGTSDACFFSCQSIKKPKKFKDPLDTENSQLVTNLAYTFSITRIAHYLKCIMRDNIGTTADAAYINTTIQNWLNQYVTTVTSPDDRTLRYYPFKAALVETVEKEGMIGWYSSTVSILPHIQFEGLDVELRLEVRL